MVRVGHGLVKQIQYGSANKSVYIGIFPFSVSAWVFPGVSILYVEKTKEVEVCSDILYPPEIRAVRCKKGVKRGA